MPQFERALPPGGLAKPTQKAPISLPITGRERALLPLTFLWCFLAEDTILWAWPHGLGIFAAVLGWYGLLGLALGRRAFGGRFAVIGEVRFQDGRAAHRQFQSFFRQRNARQFRAAGSHGQGQHRRQPKSDPFTFFHAFASCFRAFAQKRPRMTRTSSTAQRLPRAEARRVFLGTI